MFGLFLQSKRTTLWNSRTTETFTTHSRPILR